MEVVISILSEIMTKIEVKLKLPNANRKKTIFSCSRFRNVQVRDDLECSPRIYTLSNI
jgi:hypothetical protein